MDYNEFWLLETVVDAHAALSMVVGSPRYLLEQWNKPPHSLDLHSLASLLERLQSEHTIEFYDREGYGIVLSGLAIRRALSAKGLNLWYGLTPAGGQRWEEAAHPDWNRFHYHEFVFEPFEAVEVAATTFEVLNRAVAYTANSLKLRVDVNNIRYIQQQPWQATYWKSLPMGHIARFEKRLADVINRDHTDETTSATSHSYDWETESRFFQDWYSRYPVSP